MPTTSNFGWTTPADTDLVKDGAAAIRTLGNGIDTSLVDLKGGTTGQNLRKASNTDLDFTFAGDATNTVVDAAGDLLYGTANDTLGRLAIGTANQVLRVNSGATAPEWATISSGGMTLITSGNLGSSGVSLTSISQTYTDLLFWVYGAKTTAGYYGIWFSNSSGTGKYVTSMSVLDSVAGSSYINFRTQAMSAVGVTNTLAVLAKNYTSTAAAKPVSYFGHLYTGSSHYAMVGGGSTNDSAAIDRIDLQEATGSGTFTAGSYQLWGIK